MIAIETRYHGPTNTKGSHIVASANGHRLTIGVDNAVSVADNHANAAKELARKLGWRGGLIGGHTNKGMVWVWNNGPVVLLGDSDV